MLNIFCVLDKQVKKLKIPLQLISRMDHSSISLFNYRIS